MDYFQRKIELRSDALDKAGFDGVPKWEEPPAPRSDQFYLLTGKGARQTSSARRTTSCCTNMRTNPVYG